MIRRQPQRLGIARDGGGQILRLLQQNAIIELRLRIIGRNSRGALLGGQSGGAMAQFARRQRPDLHRQGIIGKVGAGRLQQRLRLGAALLAERGKRRLNLWPRHDSIR
jgi:hypothetical protein